MRGKQSGLCRSPTHDRHSLPTTRAGGNIEHIVHPQRERAIIMSDADAKPTNAADEASNPPAEDLPAPIERQHEMRLNGATLAYTSTTGMMPLSDDDGTVKAHLFYVAYVRDGLTDPAQRPLTFVFNGGPGSSSAWLHLGAVGPQRVVMQDEGWMPAPPYRLEENAHTWLDATDLVFIDPIGTGYSRALKSEDEQSFWSLSGDLKSVGQFVRRYLTQAGRWASPLYLAGESYGTTRAAGLAGHLIEQGIAFKGVLLISTVLNFQTLRFVTGNDLPYALFLPTYTATAWYHQKLDAELQGRPLRELLHEVEAWAEGEYTLALAQGDRLNPTARAAVVDKLARYTGLEPRLIEGSNLRVNIHRFCKDLLRDQRRSVGRLDSRFIGIEASANGEFPAFDPSYNAILPPYTAMVNDYLRRALGYETDREYRVLSFEVNMKWEWDRGTFPDTSEPLRAALAKNPYMQVFVGMGLYDLATPYFATEYTLNHMDIDAALRGNIVTAEYAAGHMMYLDVTSLAQLKADVAAFYQREASEDVVR